MVKKNYMARIGAVALISIAATSVTAMSDTAAVKIGGIVPVICKVGFNAASGDYNSERIVRLGATNEFCNSGRGYRVFATANGTDAGASLIVGSNSYKVSNGREILIAEVSGPSKTARNIYLDAGNGQGGGSLSIRIEAN